MLLTTMYTSQIEFEKLILITPFNYYVYDILSYKSILQSTCKYYKLSYFVETLQQYTFFVYLWLFALNFKDPWERIYTKAKDSIS